jgi:hypothetical protein
MLTHFLFYPSRARTRDTSETKNPPASVSQPRWRLPEKFIQREGVSNGRRGRDALRADVSRVIAGNVRLAWVEFQAAWHRRHGNYVQRANCAGCGQRVSGVGFARDNSPAESEFRNSPTGWSLAITRWFQRFS